MCSSGSASQSVLRRSISNWCRRRTTRPICMKSACLTARERLLPIQSVTGCETPQNLTDEQDLVPALPTYENGTYFDEIYHARTAYENVHRIEPTETSHPPLGKLFIALGTMIFGMNPFGWRVMGNLFGILMIFAIYLLARRILKKPWFAFIAAFLLTFDFMHFTQTRIATIDSYPVVFILLSYYFMYCFYAGNYQKTGLRQPLIALLCSGIFFGLACASKWTGIYSGIGLAAIFFVHMAGRLRSTCGRNAAAVRWRKRWCALTANGRWPFCCPVWHFCGDTGRYLFSVLYPLPVY